MQQPPVVVDHCTRMISTIQLKEMLGLKKPSLNYRTAQLQQKDKPGQLLQLDDQESWDFDENRLRV